METDFFKMDGLDYREIRKQIKNQEKLNKLGINNQNPRKKRKVKQKSSNEDQQDDEDDTGDNQAIDYIDEEEDSETEENDFEKTKDIKIPKFDYKIYDFNFCSDEKRLKELKKKKHEVDYFTLNGQARTLTPEEIKEINEIEASSFINWNRKEFQTFVRSCAEFGRHETSKIAKAIKTKTEEEVIEYSKKFWMNIGQLGGSYSKQRTIESGEFKLKKMEYFKKNLENIIGHHKNYKEIQFDKDLKFDKESDELTILFYKYLLYNTVKNNIDFSQVRKNLKKDHVFGDNLKIISKSEKDLDRLFFEIASKFLRHHNIDLIKPIYNIDVVQYDFEKREYLLTDYQKQALEEKKKRIYGDPNKSKKSKNKDNNKSEEEKNSKKKIPLKERLSSLSKSIPAFSSSTTLTQTRIFGFDDKDSKNVNGKKNIEEENKKEKPSSSSNNSLKRSKNSTSEAASQKPRSKKIMTNLNN